MAGHSDPFHHVRDSTILELPFEGIVQLPKVLGFQLTKFMILQVVAGLLTLLIGWGLARRVGRGGATHGRFWNFWEAIVVFLRDEVVRPTIGDSHHAHGHAHPHGESVHDDEPPAYSHPGHGGGHTHDPPRDQHSLGDWRGHDSDIHGESALSKGAAAHQLGELAHTPHAADRFLPFVWTIFFYVLFCNLLGAVPFLGSPTGDINVTGALAFSAFCMTFIAGVAELGFVGFWKNLVPPLDAPAAMKIFLVPMMFVIEVIGLLIKHGVLAVRLFANIMGGHTVVGVMLAFIAADAVLTGPLWYIVAPASVLGQVGIGLLELFVAFLQAYVFAFLATIFIGMGSHPH